MADQWYIARANKKHGPFSGAQLKQLASKRQLLPTDMLHKEGMQKWVQASAVKGLFSASESSRVAPSASPQEDSPFATIPAGASSRIVQIPTREKRTPAPGRVGWFRRLWLECKETWTATWGQTVRYFDHLGEEGEASLARERLRGCLKSLGKRVFDLGLGDPTVRWQIQTLNKRIEELNNRIQELGKRLEQEEKAKESKEAKKAIKALETDRDNYLVGLGTVAMSQPAEDTIKEDQGKVTEAQLALKQQEEKVEESAKTLGPQDRVERRRVVVGYSVVLSCILFGCCGGVSLLRNNTEEQQASSVKNTNSKTRELIVGRWEMEFGISTREYTADGKYIIGVGTERIEWTYKFVSEDKVEISKGKGAVALRVSVAGDELTETEGGIVTKYKRLSGGDKGVKPVASGVRFDHAAFSKASLKKKIIEISYVNAVQPVTNTFTAMCKPQKFKDVIGDPDNGDIGNGKNKLWTYFCSDGAIIFQVHVLGNSAIQIVKIERE